MAFSYIPPRVASILTLGSYLFLLNVFDFFAQWVLSAGLLGQILVGIVFGSSLAGWLSLEWQGAFVDLGYVGLLLIVFEGESFLMPFLTPDGGMSTELPILVRVSDRPFLRCWFRSIIYVDGYCTRSSGFV